MEESKGADEEDDEEEEKGTPLLDGASSTPKVSKANQMIEHWRQRIAEKEKEIYMPEDYNGGRPRFSSIATSDKRRIFE